MNQLQKDLNHSYTIAVREGDVARKFYTKEASEELEKTLSGNHDDADLDEARDGDGRWPN